MPVSVSHITMSTDTDNNTRGWNDDGKAELRRLIEEEEVDPYQVDAPYIKRVWAKHFDYLKLKNFYSNYRKFVKGFTKGTRKDGARRQEAGEGKSRVGFLLYIIC